MKAEAIIIQAAGKAPRIDETAYVAPTAIISGDVTVGPGCAILHGAIITAEGAPISIGPECVVMEQAVIKSSGGRDSAFPVAIGSRCLFGPHSYVVGATIADGCFIATGSCVFNNAVLEEGCGVAIGGIVHVGAHLCRGISVPMKHIAYGDPAIIVSPEHAPSAARRLNFYESVFGVPPGRPNPRALAAHRYSAFLRTFHNSDAGISKFHLPSKPVR